MVSEKAVFEATCARETPNKDCDFYLRVDVDELVTEAHGKDDKN